MYRIDKLEKKGEVLYFTLELEHAIHVDNLTLCYTLLYFTIRNIIEKHGFLIYSKLTHNDNT